MVFEDKVIFSSSINPNVLLCREVFPSQSPHHPTYTPIYGFFCSSVKINHSFQTEILSQNVTTWTITWFALSYSLGKSQNYWAWPRRGEAEQQPRARSLWHTITVSTTENPWYKNRFPRLPVSGGQ